MQKDGGTREEGLRRQQTALAEFGLLAFRSSDLDKILHRAVELVSHGLDVKRAKVLELLPGGREMLVRAGVGWNPGVVGRTTFGADHDSPAGYALSHDEPVVSPDLDAETRFEIPQVLRDHGIQSMVNVIIAGDQGPFGVLEVDSARSRQFDKDDITFLRNYANLLAAAVDRHVSHAGLENAAREKDLLIQELSHRVKNLLGLVQSIAKQTRSDDPGARAYEEAFLSRLGALARAENIIFEAQGSKLDLKQLVARSLAPFESDRAGKVTIEGPPLRVPVRSGRMLGLAMHELGTNATKHGALSCPDGEVRVSWSVQGAKGERRVDLCWIESGGPSIHPPERQGFGTRLLTSLVSYELNGHAELGYATGGLNYNLEFPFEE
jgi:two-component sensor histidine kinase